MIQIPILPDKLEQSFTIPLGTDLFDVRLYWSEDVLESGGQIYLDLTHHASGRRDLVGWALHAGVVATLPSRAGNGVVFCDCVDVEPQFDNTDRWELWYMTESEFDKWDG